MSDFLIDSNILIYSTRNLESVSEFLFKHRKRPFFISAVSYFEVLMGVRKDPVDDELVINYLDDFATIPLDKTIGKIAYRLSKSFKKKLKFNDLAIAATAAANNLTLVTADKDFLAIEGLKVKLLKI